MTTKKKLLAGTSKKKAPQPSSDAPSLRKKKVAAAASSILKVGPTTTKVNLCNGVKPGTIRIYLDASVAAGGLHLAGEDIGAAI